MHDTSELSTRYVLIIRKSHDTRAVAYGPFDTIEAAEYAAMDYYGTAITGASARDAFAITELVPWKSGTTSPRRLLAQQGRSGA